MYKLLDVAISLDKLITYVTYSVSIQIVYRYRVSQMHCAPIATNECTQRAYSGILCTLIQTHLSYSLMLRQMT